MHEELDEMKCNDWQRKSKKKTTTQNRNSQQSNHLANIEPYNLTVCINENKKTS